jgi:hypothetical protein
MWVDDKWADRTTLGNSRFHSGSPGLAYVKQMDTAPLVQHVFASQQCDFCAV